MASEKRKDVGELPLPTIAVPSTSGTKRLRVRAILLAATVFALGFYFHCHRRDRVSDVGSDFNFIHHRKLYGKRAEKVFLSVPDEASALAASRSYAELPHLAGTSSDLVSAEVQLSLFQKYFSIPSSPSDKLPIFEAGSPESRNATLSITSLTHPTAWIDTYYPILNTPLERSLEIVEDNGDVAWSADLEETDESENGDEAGKYAKDVLAWHGLSKEGDVTGPLVYVNYGTKADFDELVAVGVDFNGTIALARYGKIFRGLKVKAAQEAGSIGILIYSDPRDDGSITVENGYKPYPLGPARNPYSVQRGSVQFISSYPGDPTTPGYPSYANVTREPGYNIPSIPSLPISWANAERLLEEITELPLGKSGRKVRLVNKVDNKVTPIWNTLAVIPGHIKDEVVIVGNHRDAWVLGAADPTSGTVSIHEIVRGFGKLLSEGWTPLRTIVVASWDAEEYGLVGSTEWGEDFEDWIQEHVVTYLNLDVSVSGSRFHLSGSPSLAHLVRKTAQDLPHPTDPDRTLWDARYDSGPFVRPGDFDEDLAEIKKEDAKAEKTGVSPLGSGSDYTVFLQRIGIASTDQGFGATSGDAVYHYHSVYDSERFEEVYADPGFHRHVAIAKHLGLVALRVADSIILPINTTQYSLELGAYLDRVQDIAYDLSLDPDLSKLRSAIGKLYSASVELDVKKAKAERKLKKELKKLKKHRSHHHHGSWTMRAWWKIRTWIKSVYGVYTKPTGEDADHQFSLSRARENKPARCTLQIANHHHHHKKGKKHHLPRKFVKAVRLVQAINKKLSTFERGFISEGGIKDREWYRHLGVAPGKWLGYGATTLPALTEALSIDHNTTLAEYEAQRLTYLVERLAHSLSHP